MAREHATDREWLRTHDDAAAVLRYAAPGARVRIEPLAPTHGAFDPAVSRSRRYVLTLEHMGQRPLHVADVYTLPVEPDALRARVASLLASAR